MKFGKVIRFAAFAALAAGAGVAALATREEGREKLYQFSEVLSKAAIASGSAVSQVWQSAGEMIEDWRHRDEASFYHVQGLPQQESNGHRERQSELTHSR